MKNVTLKLTLLSLMIIGLILPGFSQKSPVGTLSKEAGALKSPRNGPAIYDQLFPPGAFTINSQAYTDPESASEINIAADDFIVPAGENWGVKYIDVLGVYSYFTGSFIDALDIRFYNNNNGVPGAEIYTALNFTQYNEILVDADFDIYKYEIMLPTAVNFAPGHYWISVQAVSDYTVTDRWNWSTHGGSTIEQEFVWKNPADGFGTGFIDWTAASMLGPIWSDFNLAFALYSEGLDNDLALVSIDSPQSSATLTASEIITVTIKNEGTGTETAFNVSYSINGGTPVVQNVGSLSLTPNQLASFSFTATADLSQPGPYNIVASVNMTGDPRPENNQFQQTVYNYGTIYEMPSSGTQTITTCGATFTDSGGLDGFYGMEDEATTTILPANAGDRVRLSFLEFDVSFGYFDIYDGTTTDAPLIGTYEGTISPGVITALNPEGALTIYFQAPGFDETEGWIAFISCVTPVANDFAILDLKSSLISVFENNTTILSAKVQNYGLQTLDKTVTFKVNNTVLGTVETGMLAPADTIRVEMPWTPTISGQYEIQVSIPADDGPDPNNSMTINPFVYPFDAFFEDFEGETFPPEGWIARGWTLNTFGGYSGSNSAEAFGPYGFSDTLQTCRIEIAAQASVSFYAASAPWWPGDMNVLWKEEGTADWVTVYHPTISGVQYNRYVVNLAGFEGQVGRLAFVAFVSDPYAWDGQILLDYILGQNVSVFFDDYDLKAVNIEGDRLYRLGETSDFVFTIKNVGLETVAGSDYRVKLMRGVENPLEVYSVPGADIQYSQELVFDLSYTFGYLGAYEIYAEIEFANDEVSSNNQSNMLMLSGLTAQSEIIQLGEPNLTDYLPINMSYKYSLSESVYNKNEIESDGGIIFGITYDYQFRTDEPNIPVRIWMTMTEQNLLYDAWIPATEMTLVYDGTLNFITGNQTLYIPFQVPFNYSDTAMNIAVMVEKLSDHTNTQQAFSTYSAGGITSRRMTSNSNPPDPNNPTSGSRIGWNPVMRLIFNHNLGTASGTVSDPEGQPINEASVTIDPLNITVLTDASGNYELPYVPAGTYPTTAYKYTYQAVTHDLEVAFGENTELDFVMGQLALVTVSGHLTGNDTNGEPIAEAFVTLTGFANYTTTSDANGNFLFENVYSQNTYSLMIEAEGYETYIVPVNIELENIDLGEIILTEALLVPYQIVTSPATIGMDIDWEHPSTNADQVWIFDDGGNDNGWAGEVGEQVWIGNLVQFEEPATITGFDMYWAKYVEFATRQPMYLDVFDADNNLIVSSNEFNSGLDEWMHISVPNITLVGDHYAMIRWDATPEQSTFLAWDSTNIVDELARYKYPGGDFAPFSNIIGKKGNMLIRPNVMTDETIPVSSRELTGYNISRGKLSDIANASDWALLNTETFTEGHFNDTTWPPSENNLYVYAVKALFTTGESEFSFSTVINYLGVNVPVNTIGKTSIYPNPTTDRVNITGCADSDIMIFSMDGRLISLTHSNDSSTSVDVSHFASGSYLLVIKNATGLKQHNLLVQ